MASMLAAKTRTMFFCGDCGLEYSKWAETYTGCGAWGSLAERPADRSRSRKGSASRSMLSTGTGPGSSTPVVLEAIEDTPEARLRTGLAEFDFVLGGGIVPGSIVLQAGAPRIGKSTILTQVSMRANTHECQKFSANIMR